MALYECGKMNHEYESGFFAPKFCPKCKGHFAQIPGVIGNLLKIAIPVGLFVVVFSFVAPNLSPKVFSHVLAALDSTTLYAYSKEAYLESVIRGRQDDRYFTLANETPYYSYIHTKADLATAEPLGVLPEKAIVEMGSALRRGEYVWIPLSFYLKDKPQQAFGLFPRDWEDTIAVYDWDERIEKIRLQYEAFVKNNFELMEVKPEDEKEYKEKYNDYFKVRDAYLISKVKDKEGKETETITYYYAPTTDKPDIEAAYSYYLSLAGKRMVVLQAEQEIVDEEKGTVRLWERPAFEIKKPEIETEGEE